MEHVGFAIAGCGQISKRHLQAINAAARADLIGVFDPISTRREEVALEWGCKCYPSYQELMYDPEVDVVNIAVPSGLHAELAIKAARAGKNLIIEKPLALSLEDAILINQEASRAKVSLSVVHPNRFKPGVAALKHALENDAFGLLTHGNAVVRWNRNKEYYNNAPWRGIKGQDGGVFMNQAIHNIDLLLWMMGDVEEVFAYTCRRLRHIETEDLGVAILRHKNGALATIEAAVTLYPRNLEESLAIFGEKGTVVLDGVHVGRIREWKIAGWDEKKTKSFIEMINADPEGKPGHQAIVEGMVSAVADKGFPPVSGEEAMKSLELVLAIYRSAETGKPVSLPLER